MMLFNIDLIDHVFNVLDSILMRWKPRDFFFKKKTKKNAVKRLTKRSEVHILVNTKKIIVNFISVFMLSTK